MGYWSRVMAGGSKSEQECLQWLRGRGLPAQWRTLVPLLWKPCTMELVQAALSQMDPSSSPGDDGVQAGVYQAFSGFFVPHMVSAYDEIERQGIPESWVVVLVRTLAKELGSAAPHSSATGAPEVADGDPTSTAARCPVSNCPTRSKGLLEGPHNV